ncbi:hypothetical protein Pmani_018686 [Petrolisthes manimaculis]|uniref:Triacylglycerol lipase n=1 Tax=Petrolisthes manimaculis TaxID=1843537 RepID=A0AAE1PJW2_9EUCA|nr:hypothetical protein Pmani_018686 [Petrolisthes manimaculis]
MAPLVQLLVLVIACMEVTSWSSQARFIREHHPGANLTTPELIEYFGYPVEVHHVTTSDGYVLELHRIPRGINETEEGGTEGKRVAYLQHCLLCSSSDWIMGNPDRALVTTHTNYSHTYHSPLITTTCHPPSPFTLLTPTLIPHHSHSSHHHSSLTIHTPYTTTHPSPFTLLTPTLIPHHSHSSHHHSSLTIHTPYTTTHPSPFTLLTPPLIPHHSHSLHHHSSLTIHTPYTTTHPSPFTLLTPPLIPHHSHSSHQHSSLTIHTPHINTHPSPFTLLTPPLIPHHSHSLHHHSSLTIHTPYTNTHPSPFTLLTPTLIPHHSHSLHQHSSLTIHTPHTNTHPSPFTLLTPTLIPHHSHSSHQHSSLTIHTPYTTTHPSPFTLLTPTLIPHHSHSLHQHSSLPISLNTTHTTTHPYPYHSTLLTPPLIRTHTTQYYSHHHSSLPISLNTTHTITHPYPYHSTLLTPPLIPTHITQYYSHHHSSLPISLNTTHTTTHPYPYHSILLTPPLIPTHITQYYSHHHSSLPISLNTTHTTTRLLSMHTAYLLADAGYDVWLGNYRGNTYSHSHLTLDPEKINYWSFSWDEMAYYDIPAMIDYMLSVTGATGVYYTGWSMGTTGFFASMSERPEYNAKIKAMAALAPVAYIDHAKGPLQELAPYANNLDTIFTLLGVGELLPSTDWMDSMVEKFCDIETQTAEVCYNLLFLIGGPDADELNKEYLPVILAHTPAGSSVHTVNHYAQGVISGKFQKYDYGLLGNLNHYGQDTPPLYSLANVTAPVGLFWGNTDWLATPQDVARLASELPNVALNFNVPKPQFNHFDFGWGLHAKELVYDYLLEFFSQH